MADLRIGFGSTGQDWDGIDRISQEIRPSTRLISRHSGVLDCSWGYAKINAKKDIITVVAIIIFFIVIIFSLKSI
jgi:hypothetical protein